MAIELFHQKGIALRLRKHESYELLRRLSMTQTLEQLPHGFLRQACELERPQPHAQQLLQGSDQRGTRVQRTVAVGPDDDDRQLPNPSGEIMHQRQGGLVSPLQIVE